MSFQKIEKESKKILFGNFVLRNITKNIEKKRQEKKREGKGMRKQKKRKGKKRK